MPFFRYSAKDADGRELQGTIQAKDQNEAQFTLAQRGLRVQAFMDGQNARPVTGTVAASPASAAIQPLPKPKRTIVGRDSDRYFIFSQLASALKAGINPAQAFHDVSNRCKPYYKESLLDLHKTATEGRDLGQTMEHYPDLYPENVVGMVRAAQTGGFLQEAFDEIGAQSLAAHKYRRWFFWVWFVVANALLSIPGIIWAMQSMVQAYKNIDAVGGEGGSGLMLQLTGKAFMQQLIWPGGPLMIAVWLVYYGLARTFGARFAKPLRHKIGLKIPPYGKRARYENLTRFSWSLSKLSRAGLAPARAWTLAADTVPNLEMRKMLAAIGTRLSGAEKMSNIIHGSPLFPDEYSSMVATAEYTGDMPGIMQQLSDLSRGEMQAAETYSKYRSSVWGCLGCFVTSAAIMGIFWYFMYYVLMPTVLKGFEQ